jgi:two-component system NtrC family sensor kinase
MRKSLYTFFLVFTVILGTAQQMKPDSMQHGLNPAYYSPRELYIGRLDSLLHELNTSTNDTSRLDLTSILWEYYIEIKPDSAVYFGRQNLALAQKLNLKLDEATALSMMGFGLKVMGNYPESLEVLLSALVIAEDPKNEKNILPARYLDKMNFPKNVSPENIRLSALSQTHLALGSLYGNTGNHQKQMFHYFRTIQLAEQINSQFLLCLSYKNLGETYYSLNRLDSEQQYARKAYDLSLKYGFKRYLGSTLVDLGRIELKKGNRSLAKKYFLAAATANDENHSTLTDSYLLLANLYLQSGEKDSSLYYARKGFVAAQDLQMPGLMLKADTTLAAIYKTTNIDSAYKYQAMSIKISDSIFSAQKVQQFQNIGFDEQLRRQQLQAAEATFQNRLRMYSLLAALGIILLVALILWRNNRQRKKANILLRQQKEEVQTTLIELRSTQGQLIQSEKMASLGELTAGIAHEIQNPLNFVNNFSEVNTELIDELKNELNSGNKEEAISIADDIKENEGKINHHGKRADAIVKGMLQHSRSSTGHKEPTDINALADEYLRLSYHGFRAKDKTFNATLQTNFDESIGKINMIPQDIGRVLLNLYNNAFYAVSEKKKQQGESYEPTVSISTKKLSSPPTGGDGGIEIRVRDNGFGIPQKVLDKIYQPFFTTKPTGQGTGLGLSLSYDIIKAHGGEIKVETKEGEGAEFVISLAIS